MKRQIITPDMIKEATITCVAEYGLENLTTKKVALAMGISEGTIFNNFSSKKDLLAECLYHIDRQVDVALRSVHFDSLRPAKMVRTLCFSYFDFFLAHGDYAKFYLQYHRSSYYDAEVMAEQEKAFSFFSTFLHKYSYLFGFDPTLYWVFLIETTLNFAVHIADGHLPHTEKDIERIYSLISHGFVGSLKPGSESVIQYAKEAVTKYLYPPSDSVQFQQ